MKVHFPKQLCNRSEELKTLMDDVEEQWQFFKEAHVDVATTAVGVRRPKKEEWVQSNTWSLVEERKELKKRDSSKTTVLQQEYVDKDKEVKRCSDDMVKRPERDTNQPEKYGEKSQAWRDRYEESRAKLIPW
ncbi:hypothetical protein KIL84_022102 [Mauremys mutica]|uniref:Uncharacterized protein n=1 Tax=Mauremys mutica TaxID=74926 RepID=A0A9D3X9U5_9SAUR|nr:hypothetical protein KIL84_022102 [Mauremys mutica]